MAAWQIPLSVTQPTFETPLQAQGQAMTLQGMAQGRVLKNQEIQENALKIKAEQRAQDANQALTDALGEGFTKGDDGKYTLNHDAVMGKLIKGGWGPEALKIDALKRSDLTNAATNLSAQLKAQAEKDARMGSLIGSIPQIDFNEVDPDRLAAQKQAHLAGVQNAISQGLSEGLIDQTHAATALQWAQNPTPQTAAQFKQIADQGMARKDQIEALQKSLDSGILNRERQANTTKTEAQIPGIKADSEQKQRAADAAILAVAARKGPEAYAKIIGDMPYARAKAFEGITDPDKILLAGQTANQQSEIGLKTSERDVKLKQVAAELIKVGINPDDVAKATDPNAAPDVRAAIIRKIGSDVTRLKVNEQVQAHVGSQLGVLNAMMGGGFAGGGGAPAPAQVPASTPIQAPPQMPVGAVAAPATAVPPAQPIQAPVARPAQPVAAQPVQAPASVVTAVAPAATGVDPNTGRNEAYLDNLVKSGKLSQTVADKIRAIADGRSILPPRSSSGPIGMLNEMMSQHLLQYDPGYDYTDPAKRMKTAQAYSAGGKVGQGINALGTALQHGAELSDLIENLNNTNFPKYNSIAQWVKNNTGSPEVKQFINVRDKFADEMTKAWGASALGDRKAAIDTLATTDSPKTLKKLMNDNVTLLMGKYNEARDQYKSDMGKELKTGISKTAEEAAQKIRSRSGLPTKGDHIMHEGHPYTFDGTQWTLDKK